MSQRESIPLSVRDKPKISHINHPDTGNSTKKKRSRKATTTPRPSRAKRQVKATNAAKLDNLRQSTKTGRQNKTDPVDRMTALSEDEWAASVQPHIVICKGCHKPIKLDVRYGQYYRSNWSKHKKLCKKIKQARKEKELARATEPKEAGLSNDENVCSDMEIDSESESKTEPDVTRDDSPHAIDTSTPEAVNALTLATNAQSEKPPSNKVVENPFTNVKESVRSITPYLTYKFARYTSRAVVTLDQTSVELLAQHREHLHRI
ncbi:hypothetical protein C0992_003805 [Termitomyces sp. T32_za158]|nr:hypothetical protein C0992_003805 [Termitomyces sp. T32_za158]